LKKGTPGFTNALINESSPYLIQHAHNPVQWHAWNSATLLKAKKANKPLIISIGYSACHWCHVMAHETFEDEEIAKIMNASFICIKVDREERPEIDQIYMDAVILMTGSGGWPLNCFALPDGRPFYGGTYFPPATWTGLIKELAKVYKEDPEKLVRYAEKVVQGIKQNELIEKHPDATDFSIQYVKDLISKLRGNFDLDNGGTKNSPKFPMPKNQIFLLRYAFHSKDDDLMDYVKLTLNKMALGGIYDHVGGGFARYSTDSHWKVPHFEKMLYDNAQLVSLYSEAFRVTKNPLYSKVVFETLAFIEKSLTSPEDAFYSSLDADSEGEEGKYYTWSEDELKDALGDKYESARQIFSIDQDGYWKDGRYILLINNDIKVIAEKLGLSVNELFKILEEIKSLLNNRRVKRIPPDTDTKVLTSWNALMIRAYVDAYHALNNQEYLDRAIKASEYLIEKVNENGGDLFHTIDNKTSIPGHLDDYCFVIDAFIALYQAAYDEKWLHKAKALTDYTIKHFFNPTNGMFFYTSDLGPELIARKFEISDNVIPSSNSAMAHNLFLLAHFFEDNHYLGMSKQMIQNTISRMEDYPSGFNNWSLLYLNFVIPFYEVAICGNDSGTLGDEIQHIYIPNKILALSKNASRLPLLIKERFVEGKTLIYVCVNNTCLAPLESVEQAVKIMETSISS
jgi:hypothetical protein